MKKNIAEKRYKEIKKGRMKENVADTFFDDIRNGGNTTVQYLLTEGGSQYWIKSLLNKVENASQQEFDFMKNDLKFHFKLLKKKTVPYGEKWKRNLPKNLTDEMMNCKDCKMKLFDFQHLLDMHPTFFLYIMDGTDKGITEDTIQFTKSN
tara:strand:+ start:66 stop:515 length:450 start_codon:yes stop_codon:yes gene_type:complete